MQDNKDRWNTKTGVILAVAGSAVGIANFLKFPGQAAQFGGGAFMIAYIISLLLLALPLAWTEWTLGRLGGKHGFSSGPGIYYAVSQKPWVKYLGILCVLCPFFIYTYLAYIQAWCLGYAVNFATGSLHFSSVQEATAFWATFIGAEEHGSALKFGFQAAGTYLILTFILNFFISYRGISKGIELFCRYAVPLLIVVAIVILLRVITLGTPDPAQPHNNINNGMGYLWNPNKVVYETKQGSHWITVTEVVGTTAIAEYQAQVDQDPTQARIRTITLWDQLKRPKLWLAAASQIFFSLSIGFGLVITYASYMKPDDDVVLSSLTAVSANEFCEVGLGGLISVPAAYAFLGAAGVAGQGIFGLGFKVLPMVFSSMHLGSLFGFLFFVLLFLAAANGSISCLQPSIAFLEETMGYSRRRSVLTVAPILLIGCFFVLYFSKDAIALHSLDFWVGNVLIYICALSQLLLFGWVLGTRKGLEETHRGAALRIPSFYHGIIKFLCPLFLVIIFSCWILFDVIGLGGNSLDPHIVHLIGSEDTPPSRVAQACFVMVLLGIGVMIALIRRASAYKTLTIKN